MKRMLLLLLVVSKNKKGFKDDFCCRLVISEKIKFIYVFSLCIHDTLSFEIIVFLCTTGILLTNAWIFFI